MIDPAIRLVRPDDIPQILDIYAPYIENTAVTFEYEVPSLNIFASRVETISSIYPFLVLESEDGIKGYAYATRHMERAAYRYDVQCSVYLTADSTGKRYGHELYKRLFSLLTIQGFYNAYALIAMPNPASEALHRRMGFEQIGMHTRTGYKFGEWLNVLWMIKRLQDFSRTPGELRPIRETEPDRIDMILKDG